MAQATCDKRRYVAASAGATYAQRAITAGQRRHHGYRASLLGHFHALLAVSGRKINNAGYVVNTRCRQHDMMRLRQDGATHDARKPQYRRACKNGKGQAWLEYDAMNII